MIHRSLSRPAACAAVGFVLAISACSGSFDQPSGPTTPTAVPFELAVASGRIERSRVVTLVVRRNGVDAPFLGAVISASPASSARITDSTVTLLEAGRLQLVVSQGGLVDTLVLDVAVPPTVVFDRDDAGIHHIYTIALDGRSLVRLTSGASDDIKPTSGGGSVVYASFSAGQSDLRRVALTGGASIALTNTATQFETDPALSADGAQLAFTRSGVTDGVPKLWLAAGDGSGARAAAATLGTSGSVDAAPRWTRDGARLAFVSTASGTSQLYALVRASGAVSLLGVGAGPNVSPAWNAAGTTLAFSSARNGAPGLYETDAMGAGAVWLIRGSEGEPSWTADGRIVYTTYATGISRLRWVDPSDPATVYEIETGDGSAAHPTVVP